MPIKRLYNKLTSDEVATGFDSDTLSDRKKETDVKGQRLQLIVYTALFAFIILAAYGYYLIFNLTHDMHAMRNDVGQMTQAVNKMSESVNVNMKVISKNMLLMQSNMQRIAITVSDTMPIMSDNTTQMTKVAKNVSDRMDGMSTNISTMSTGIVSMQRDIWSMNNSLSNPTEAMFDGMIPWGGNSRRNANSHGPMAFPRPIR